MSQINIRNLSNENDDGSPEIVGVSTFSATSFFVPPKGSTAERPTDCEPGSIRFNTDTSNLEYFRGKTLGWSQFELVNPNLGGGTGSNTGLGTRGIFGSGEAPHGDTIDFLTISTFGDSTDFGNLSQERMSGGSMGSSETRGLFAGGQHPSPFTFFNIIDFVTIASTGDANDFGDLSTVRTTPAPAASSTRGVFGGGVDTTNVIDFITISSTGDATDFGDLSVARKGAAGCSNSTRALFGGGESPSNSNVIDFVTIATTGNAADFGDLTAARNTTEATSSPTRGIFAGDGNTDTLDKVEILTTGNAVDFGNLGRGASRTYGAFSNGHGGL